MRRLHLTRVDGKIVRVSLEQEVALPGAMIFFGDGTPLGMTASSLCIETDIWNDSAGTMPEWEDYRL